MPGAARLELRIAAKGFGAVQVLRDLDLRLQPGSCTAVLAPSGTGKTTLLRIALGLDRDFARQVRREARHVGALFQEPRLLPWMTVQDNIRLVRRSGMPEADIPGLLAALGLQGTEFLFPRALSLGMARRVALARALAVAPDLLVLDEPFASLDPGLAGLVGAALRRLPAEGGCTCLVTTHDLGQAIALAQRVVVLGGRPATLRADVAVPQGGGKSAIADLCDSLRASFPFLSEATGEGGQSMPALP